MGSIPRGLFVTTGVATMWYFDVPICGAELQCAPGEVAACVLFAGHDEDPPGSPCWDGEALTWVVAVSA